MRHSSLRAALAFVSVLSLAGCDPTGPDYGPAAAIELESGWGDSVAAGDTAETRLVVRFTDAEGRAVRRERIFWLLRGEPCGGYGGLLIPDRPTVTTTPGVYVESVTDDRGRASARWVGGTRAGTCEVDVGVAPESEGDVTPLHAVGTTRVIPNVARLGVLERLRGDAQAVVSGQPAADSLVVRIRDVYGNLVAGQSVTWRVVEGGGTVSPTTSVSDAQGRAATGLTAGTAGAQRVEATVMGGAPTQFTARLAVPLRGVQAAAVNSYDTCVLVTDGTLYCWGYQRPVARVAGAPPLTSIVARGGVSSPPMGFCGPDASGRAYCAPVGGAFAPMQDSLRFTQLAAQGHWHSTVCGLLAGGEVRCFDAADRVVAATPDLRLRSITSGGASVLCGIAESGVAHCGPPGTMAPVPGGASLTAVSAGFVELMQFYHPYACGLDAAGAAYCWGLNKYYVSGRPAYYVYDALGAGSDAYSSSTPLTVSGGHRFASIVAGQAGACGLTTGGALYCWGGRNSPGPHPPVRVYPELTFVRQLSMRCAVTADDVTYCGGAVVEQPTTP